MDYPNPTTSAYLTLCWEQRQSDAISLTAGESSQVPLAVVALTAGYMNSHHRFCILAVVRQKSRMTYP